MFACGAAASCSSADDERELGPADAGPEAFAPTDDAAPSDAGGGDVTAPDAAPAPFDGGPLPVVCSSDPCATALVTTLALDDSQPSEGYCALLRDGTVACWGANEVGQLGRGDDAGTSNSAVAGRVVGLSEVEELDHTCAVDKSGGIWCWGTGPYLRDGTGARTTERAPIKLPLAPAKHVGVGTDVACASNDDGLLCWGKNTNGTFAPLTTMPADTLVAPRPIDLPSGPPIREIRVRQASFVLREDGATLSWGANPPLGRVSSYTPDPYPLPIPLTGVSSIDLASESGCATAGGVGYCWGRLNLRDVSAVTPPVRTLPEPVVAPEPLVQIATTSLWVDKSLGTPTVRRQRWCAVGASGAVYCWGPNANGQAGDGTKEFAHRAVKVEGLPKAAARVKTMPESTCALLTNGKVYCWGSNYYGQLGNGKPRARTLVPEEVVLP
ncbi:MAG: hypothetical protein BGO98_21880 [Myxococcales bacterium 68-20]|nr:MAG: hypothetical protein BGO98_21880 [Myxococcales bacterium 68-20]